MPFTKTFLPLLYHDNDSSSVAKLKQKQERLNPSQEEPLSHYEGTVTCCFLQPYTCIGSNSQLEGSWAKLTQRRSCFLLFMTSASKTRKPVQSTAIHQGRWIGCRKGKVRRIGLLKPLPYMLVFYENEKFITVLVLVTSPPLVSTSIFMTVLNYQPYFHFIKWLVFSLTKCFHREWQAT